MTVEDMEARALWVLEGFVLVRKISSKLRDSMENGTGTTRFQDDGIRRVQIYWNAPAFVDPDDFGWDERRWFPCKGPFLKHWHPVESDVVPLQDTEVFKVVSAHFPEVASRFQETLLGESETAIIRQVDELEEDVDDIPKLVPEELEIEEQECKVDTHFEVLSQWFDIL
ncbi:hypothetical protein BJ508DRAFT_376134 [Ascobolus immersus RN42]|uniref:Uncharacterized protein n=1 Tax=Ascobolus immersus RN42 TaxID=1160509 RepID=A0A3N4I972_ASCIM|nr:hypothetical protein BJ508DRAFT_376134 [Ascobolus immersus RN42]